MADITLCYGHLPEALAACASDAIQTSPLVVGSTALESLPEGGASEATMLAPPGTLERRRDVALVLRALAPDASFTVLAPKDKGGARLVAELAAFGCRVDGTAKRHHRICRGRRPAVLADLAHALADGAPRRLPDLGLWSQPGIFSWDRCDAGTALLSEALPDLAGTGADLGCGIGILAHRILASQNVTRLTLVDLDRRAVEAARRNVDDARVEIIWADVRAGTGLRRLDFVVMNPPFHAAGSEDRQLGRLFIARAAEALRPGGRLWLVANRHLPYEAVLASAFRQVVPRAEGRGYKVLEALA